MTQTLVLDAFSRCVEAIVGGKLIIRQSRRDKEFHFQDWFAHRLAETGADFEQVGKNKYPDFSLTGSTLSYESNHGPTLPQTGHFQHTFVGVEPAR